MTDVMNPLERVIAGALDDIDLVFDGSPYRWDQANAILAALTRYGYTIQQKGETL